MVKMCELSLNVRQEIVSRISATMVRDYQIDKESVDEFWDACALGIEMKERV